MKGLELSLSMVITFVVAIMIIMLLGILLSGNITSVEEFGLSNIDLTIGGL